MAAKKTNSTPKPLADASVTICVCTRDRPYNLHACLKSIADGEVLPAEVIVSDDGADVASTTGLCAEFPFVRCVAGPHRGLCANRNHVIAQVRTSHVSLLDDDAVVDRNFVKLALEHARKGDQRIIVTGNILEMGERLICPGDSDFCGHFTYGPPHPKWWKRGTGRFETIQLNCNLFPTKAFSEASFDELIEFGFEDMDLCSDLLARGYRIEWDPAMVNNHLPPARKDNEQSKRHRLWTQARYYTSLKRYFVWNRQPHLGFAYLLIAPTKVILHSIKWRKWQDILPTPHNLLTAVRLFLRFRREHGMLAGKGPEQRI